MKIGNIITLLYSLLLLLAASYNRCVRIFSLSRVSVRSLPTVKLCAYDIVAAFEYRHAYCFSSRLFHMEKRRGLCAEQSEILALYLLLALCMGGCVCRCVGIHST